MRDRFVCAALAGVVVVLAACGGTPAAPSQSPATSVAKTASPAPPSSSAEAAPTAPTAAASTPPTSGSDDWAKPTQKPKDMITAPDVMFLLDFGSSDAGKAAEQKCASTADAAGCVAKARDKIQTNALRFKQDPQKNWWWHSMQKKGSDLLLLHKVLVDFADETDRSIVIKPKGKDQGMTPWAQVPGSVQIEVPTNFSIVVHDPQHGKLVYEARIGIAGK